MKKLILIVCLFTCVAANRMAAQTPGNLDSSFGTNGKLMVLPGYQAEGMFIEAEQELAGGKFISLMRTYITGADNMETYQYFLQQVAADGSPDLTFGQGGKTKLGFNANSVLMKSDGKILVLGNDDEEIVMSRYLANGSLDISFGNNGTVYTGIFTLLRTAAWQPDGKIVIGAAVLGNTKMLVGRLWDDGSRDFSFGEDGLIIVDYNAGNQQEWVTRLNVLPDLRIMVTGITIENNNYYSALLRLTSNGQPDSAFSSDGRQNIPYAIKPTAMPTAALA